jgi:putative transposase
MPWKTFLKAHWGAIAAADFFSVEFLTRGGPVRYLVLFVIDVKTRRVHVAGVTSQADGTWMAQIARNLTDAVAGPLRGYRHLIVDRDPLYTAHMQSLLRVAGVSLLWLPPSSPNLTPTRSGSFAQAGVPPAHRPARRASSAHRSREFIEHYHSERNN